VSDKRIDRAIEKLKREILALGALVEEGLFLSFKAYEQRNGVAAEQVIESDTVIDEREVEIEEECLKTLALYQPTGRDLRMTVAVMKMTNDLERIGDCAVNIAWQAHSLAYLKPIEAPSTMGEMAAKTKSMLRSCLESLVNLDLNAAWGVLASDDEIDVLNREHKEWLLQKIQSQPANAESLLFHMSVSKNLERIADHVTNLAEDIIYMVDGEIVRHGRAQRKVA
jgi:phosphate transport system protein